MNAWDREHRTQRLWARDASLWTNSDEAKSLGWLDVVKTSLTNGPDLLSFASEVRTSGVKHVTLLGMGGSSLCARVFQKTFGVIDGFPELNVLDSTDPAQILHLEEKLPRPALRGEGRGEGPSLFIVSSKSGTTLETRLLHRYFASEPSRFIAITDPSTPLASDANFLRVFHGMESIGGRFNALSNFGMVPAALMGVDIVRVLESAKRMFHACGPSIPAKDNPGVTLGLFLGEHALAGRDKMTLLISPRITELGAWIEQLIAESTGKSGKGIIPVDREPLGRVEKYSDDRSFVYVRLKGDDDSGLDALAEQLQGKGHPLHIIDCQDVHDLGAEFFRWEFATAVAGSLLGVNPFDQPDVESTKKATQELTQRYSTISELPKAPDFDAQAMLDQIKTHDYFCICAFIEMNEEHAGLLRELRSIVRSKKGIATTHGFGPCFLHSTGQLHKGGPNSGVFLQITCDDQKSLRIPDEALTFSLVKAAQAQGDFEVLRERGRRVFRHHIKGDVAPGLRELLRKLT